MAADPMTETAGTSGHPETGEGAQGLCAVIDGFGRCTGFGVAHIVAGCVHEHVRTGLVCDIHARRSTTLCNDCYSTHRCELRIISTTHLAVSS